MVWYMGIESTGGWKIYPPVTLPRGIFVMETSRVPFEFTNCVIHLRQSLWVRVLSIFFFRTASVFFHFFFFKFLILPSRPSRRGLLYVIFKVSGQMVWYMGIESTGGWKIYPPVTLPRGIFVMETSRVPFEFTNCVIHLRQSLWVRVLSIFFFRTASVFFHFFFFKFLILPSRPSRRGLLYVIFKVSGQMVWYMGIESTGGWKIYPPVTLPSPSRVV
jgi:hypothetical protein